MSLAPLACADCGATPRAGWRGWVLLLVAGRRICVRCYCDGGRR